MNNFNEIQIIQNFKIESSSVWWICLWVSLMMVSLQWSSVCLVWGHDSDWALITGHRRTLQLTILPSLIREQRPGTSQTELMEDDSMKILKIWIVGSEDFYGSSQHCWEYLFKLLLRIFSAFITQLFFHLQGAVEATATIYVNK